MAVSLYDRFTQLGASFFGQPAATSSDSSAQTFHATPDRYALAESYYTNTAYEDWGTLLKSTQGLYRLTSGVYNPIRRAVNWYPGALYPGAWSTDGLPLPDGRPCRVPFATDVPEEIRIAAMATLEWGNWGEDLKVLSRMLPLLGDAFIEIAVDDLRSKVYPKLHHPRYVTDMAWNAAGDVIMYRLEIGQEDDNHVSYTWGRVVTKESFTTLRDGRPYSYNGVPATIPNEYGFVPAVWVQFQNVGGQHGGNLLDGVRAKIDRLNSSASSVHDLMAKLAAQPVILKTAGSTKNLEILPIGDATASRPNPVAGKGDVAFLKGPLDLEVLRLLEFPELTSELAIMHDLMMEIKADIPEASLDEQVRQLAGTSGVALQMMFGDVIKRRADAQDNADGGLRKMIQMSLAIMGHTLKSSRFGPRSGFTDAQKLFLPFDLDSYARGDLAISFMDRPLFPDTPMERIQAALARETLHTIQGLRESGYSDDDIFGVGQAPAIIPGLLEQRQQTTTSTADLLGRALGRGAVA